jgi:hypothetical protein
MNRITSENKQSYKDPIIRIAKRKFRELALSLQNNNRIDEYSIVENDKQLSLKLNNSKRNLSLNISLSGEIFWSCLNKTYVDRSFAYISEDKMRSLGDMIKDASDIFDAAVLHEEIYEKSGHIVFRRLIFANGATRSASTAFAGRLRRHFGYKKRII